jgi:hypothetical protein
VEKCLFLTLFLAKYGRGVWASSVKKIRMLRTRSFRNLAPLTRKRIQQRRVIGPRMNRKLSWLIWGVALLATIWLLLYVVGYYLGEVGN